MKTLEEIYNEITGDEETKKAFEQACKDKKMEEFFQKNEISDDDLSSIAGGKNISVYNLHGKFIRV